MRLFSCRINELLISEWKPILYIVLAKAMSMHLTLLWMCVRHRYIDMR